MSNSHKVGVFLWILTYLLGCSVKQGEDESGTVGLKDAEIQQAVASSEQAQALLAELRSRGCAMDAAESAIVRPEVRHSSAAVYSLRATCNGGKRLAIFVASVGPTGLVEVAAADTDLAGTRPMEILSFHFGSLRVQQQNEAFWKSVYTPAVLGVRAGVGNVGSLASAQRIAGSTMAQGESCGNVSHWMGYGACCATSAAVQSCFSLLHDFFQNWNDRIQLVINLTTDRWLTVIRETVEYDVFLPQQNGNTQLCAWNSLENARWCGNSIEGNQHWDFYNDMVASNGGTADQYWRMDIAHRRCGRSEVRAQYADDRACYETEIRYVDDAHTTVLTVSPPPFESYQPVQGRFAERDSWCATQTVCDAAPVAPVEAIAGAAMNLEWIQNNANVGIVDGVMDGPEAQLAGHGMSNSGCAGPPTCFNAGPYAPCDAEKTYSCSGTTLVTTYMINMKDTATTPGQCVPGATCAPQDCQYTCSTSGAGGAVYWGDKTNDFGSNPPNPGAETVWTSAMQTAMCADISGSPPDCDPSTP